MAEQVGRLEEELPCVLSADELQSRGRLLGSTVVQIDDIEAARTEKMKEFKEAKTGLVELQRKLSAMIRTGIEKRMVECRVFFHVPAEGQKRVVRLDTGEVVREEEMTAAEKQMNLFASPEQLADLLGETAEADEAPAPEDQAEDALYRDAVRAVFEFRKNSASFLQGRLRIGYGRAVDLIAAMERGGVLGPASGRGAREILKRPDWLLAEDAAQPHEDDGEDDPPVVN